jgi:hypothetical protein
VATTPIGLFAGSLIGDVLIQARETVPDMPQTLFVPTFLTAAPATVGGASVPAGNWFLVITAVNQWGETTATSNEIEVTVGGGQNAVNVNYIAPPGTVFINVYFGQTSGNENLYVQIPALGSGTGQITSLFGVNAAPPVRNTAWLPDTDGGFISSGAIFRWLNAALEIIARGTGGFQDYSAVGSTINQPLYQIPGNWNAITSIWYDGYWMQGGDPGYFWRRNSITSQVLSSAHISHNSGRTILEVYPQPARTAQTTTLAGPMTIADTVANLTNCQFVLPFGFCSIGSEIVAYATINGNQLTGLIRGLGGTSILPHNASESVVECNIAWMGKRQSSQKYAPGQSGVTLPVTSGWDQLIVQYIAGRAKIVEHDMQSMSAFNQDMEKQVQGWAKVNNSVVRRRQVGGPNGPLVYYPDIAGGLIVN